jgi:hypothetical protein
LLLGRVFRNSLFLKNYCHEKKTSVIRNFHIIAPRLHYRLKGTFDGYYGFYYENKTYQKPLVYTACENITQSLPVSMFTSYTGFDTGYGFYAPNVASDFVMSFELKDEKELFWKKNVTIFQKQRKQSKIHYCFQYVS